jgi:KaiC/GvpD/RAD55 family RecA-like ATPase
MNVNFIKEIIPHTENNNLLVLINQIQSKHAVNFLLKSLFGKKIVLVTFTSPKKKFLDIFENNNFFIIDAYSNEKSEGEHFISLKNSNDLVQIQIAIKKAIQKIGNAIIIFDSLNILSIYNSPKDLGKFFHIFSNKMKLSNNSCIFFATENSVDDKTLDFAKQFFDKTFDFTKVAAYTIESKK